MNIFCTRKLETFITAKKKSEYNDEGGENCLCHLIPVGGKKKSVFYREKNFILCFAFKHSKKRLSKHRINFYR
jgi:hypothetical protein